MEDFNLCRKAEADIRDSEMFAEADAREDCDWDYDHQEYSE